MLFYILLILLYIPLRLLYPTKVIGKKNLLKGKCIWACNHMTNMDIVILHVIARRKINPLAKKELF